MKTFFLSFPRLPVSLAVPDEMVPDVQSAFRHSIRPETDALPLHEYAIQPASHGLILRNNGQAEGTFSSPMDALIHLEESIEVLLINAMNGWAAFHAGAVEIDGAGWLIAGHPDTGKTTTTFNLIEMGGLFLCEEVSPVDPDGPLIHPYPQVLSMSRSYAEAYRSIHPVRGGDLTLPTPRLARYAPHQAGSVPARLKVILLPVYDPACAAGIETVSPESALTELLGYAFPPSRGDEHLFDAVIRICEKTRIFRLRANSLGATRRLLKDLMRANADNPIPPWRDSPGDHPNETTEKGLTGPAEHAKHFSLKNKRCPSLCAP